MTLEALLRSIFRLGNAVFDGPKEVIRGYSGETGSRSILVLLFTGYLVSMNLAVFFPAKSRGLVSFVITIGLWLCSLSLVQGQQASPRPEARWGHAFIYYPTHDQLLLFGGASASNQYLGDTWLWDGTQWQQLDVSGPAPRGFSAITFHEQRGTVILHGGRGNEGVTYADLWEWDGRRWQVLHADGEFKADHHEMVYVPEEQSIVAFGGWNGEEILDDTWIWAGKWQKSERPSPPGRSAFGMTYDKMAKKIVLFGGLWINGQYADLWEWSGGEWSVRGGPYDRSSLDHHSLVYDGNENKVMGFGGKNYRYVARPETFTITDGEISIMATSGPVARHSFGSGFHEKSGRVYLFGGKQYLNGQQVALGDLWAWNGERWEQVH